MRSSEARELGTLVRKLKQASPNARVDALLDDADMAVRTLDAKLAAATSEARESDLARRREHWDAEKAYQDGYAQGLADGYGQALDWVAEGCHG